MHVTIANFNTSRPGMQTTSGSISFLWTYLAVLFSEVALVLVVCFLKENTKNNIFYATGLVTAGF